MILKMWRSDLDSSRLDEYERLETESLHMWNRQAGFVAVLFSRNGPDKAVLLSIWDDQKGADALSESSSYKDFMKKLLDSGILKGAAVEETFEVAGGYLPSVVNHKFRAGTHTNATVPSAIATFG